MSITRRECPFPHVSTLPWWHEKVSYFTLFIAFVYLFFMAALTNGVDATYSRYTPSITCQSRYAVCIVSPPYRGPYEKSGQDYQSLPSLLASQCDVCSYSTNEMRLCRPLLGRAVYKNENVQGSAVVVLGEDFWDPFTARKLLDVGIEWRTAAPPILALLATNRQTPPRYPIPDLFFHVDGKSRLQWAFKDIAVELCDLLKRRVAKPPRVTREPKPPSPTPSLSSTPTSIPSPSSKPIASQSPIPIPIFDPSKPPEFNLEILRLSIEREIVPPLGADTLVTADLISISSSPTPLPRLSRTPVPRPSRTPKPRPRKSCSPTPTPSPAKPYYPPQNPWPRYPKPQYPKPHYPSPPHDPWHSNHHYLYYHSSMIVHDHEYQLPIDMIRQVTQSCSRANCAARVTIRASTFIRRDIVTRAVRMLLNRPGFSSIFETDRSRYTIRRIGNQRFVVIIPFKNMYLQEFGV